MKLNQLLTLTAIPALLGTLAFASVNKINAASPSSLTIAQNQPPQGQRRPRRQKPNLKAAAEKLGITEQQLKDALGRPPQPDFAAAASKLGTSEGELKEALGLPENPPELSEGQRPPKPDFKAAAAKLGVTKQQIKEAFGPRPRKDLSAAASKLGISEEELKEALGVPENPPERPE
ncbi:hypothetical protein Riv7116_3360 [Rivularia sp. PCC 7116]|uniref:hypothetical protein n=1 Tax=Rivularia sp. PCC 7116 TaxID=373994 RepID=UPI00029F374A|nr:hypothetical protein [Rivularia sp. PCC 7116]AFY55819.1 hypothetical protein Riv7116_3360 [Rivularia sp. PCC 7116]